MKWFRNVLLGAVLFCVGCVADKLFYDAQEATWKVVGPQYKAYVAADATISQEQRDARLSLAQFEDDVLTAHRKVVYGDGDQ